MADRSETIPSRWSNASCCVSHTGTMFKGCILSKEAFNVIIRISAMVHDPPKIGALVYLHRELSVEGSCLHRYPIRFLTKYQKFPCFFKTDSSSANSSVLPLFARGEHISRIVPCSQHYMFASISILAPALLLP